MTTVVDGRGKPNKRITLKAVSGPIGYVGLDSCNCNMCQLVKDQWQRDTTKHALHKEEEDDDDDESVHR